ncbi:MAG: RidA family protein [Proteobacteria bacterium]|nr:RidA family protein [Pseudomonadota bacterium]
MKTINSKEAPLAKGPYSHAVSSGDLLFLSGQIALDPASDKLVTGDIGTQTQQIFKNIESVLKEAGLSLGHIVKTTVFLKDMNDFQVFNTAYQECLSGHKPARSTVEVARLPLDARIEIECIAAY